MLLVQVILASTRDGRFSERAGRWVRERLETRGDMQIELIDLRDYPLPFFDGVAPARTLRDYPAPRSRASVRPSIGPTDS
jgi:NAD(P)H-dependent FMN reductase